MVRKLLALAGSLVLVSAAAAQDQEIIRKTLDAWKKKQSALKSVRYAISGTSERTPASLDEVARKTFPPSKLRPTPVRAVVLIDLEKSRYRIESGEEILSLVINDFEPHFTILTWDGKDCRARIPKEENPGRRELSNDVLISTGKVIPESIEMTFWPIFAAHGYVATVNTPLRPTGFPPRHDPDHFQYRGKLPLHGNNCVILRTEPVNSVPALIDELWVDPARDHAVVRQVYLGPKHPACRMDAEYQRLAHGWAPSRLTITSMSGGVVMGVSRLTVTAVEANPAVTDADFTVQLKPKMRVGLYKYPDAGTGLNPAVPAQETCVVDEDGTLRRLDATGYTTVQGKQLLPEPERPGWLWWLLGAAAVGALGAGFAYWRSQKSRVGA